MAPHPSTSKSLIATSHGWELVDRELPSLDEIPSSPTGLVRICLARASVSHTQAQVMSRQRTVPEGRVLGHEGVGWVVSATPRAKAWMADHYINLTPGDRVVVFPFLPCAGFDDQGNSVECPACQADRPEDCPRLKALGLDADGLLTQWCDLPPQVLHRVPPTWPVNEQSWTDLLFTESVAQALVAATLPVLGSAKHIAVVGRGPVHELTARIIEAVHYGWTFPSEKSPTSVPPHLATDSPMGAMLANTAQDETISEEIRKSREEAWLSSVKVRRLDPSALPRHPRTFDVIIETWADPASLSDMFQALRSNGVLVRKSRPGRALSLLRQPAPMMPVRVVEASYGSFSSALAWMSKNPGALRDLDQDSHKYSASRSTPSQQKSPEYHGFPFTPQGFQAALDADRRRDQLGKVFMRIHDQQPPLD